MEKIRNDIDHLDVFVHNILTNTLSSTAIAFNFEELSEENMNLEIRSERLRSSSGGEIGIVKGEILEGLSSLRFPTTSVGENAARWETFPHIL